MKRGATRTVITTRVAPLFIETSKQTEVQGSALVGVEGAKPLALLAFSAGTP
jgi:hypothetical protein